MYTYTERPNYTTRPNRVKALIREGKIALGTYAAMADAGQVEAAGLNGFDAVSMHWEHTSMDFHMMEDMIRAAEAVDMDCIVRVPYLDPQLIARVLALGTHGIWLPHDGSGLEGAKRALDAMRYPPKGHRGTNLRTRATGYGAVSWEDPYTRSEDIVLVVPIEDPKAMEQVEEIAALDGVDLLFVAVFGVSEVLGVSWDDPRVLQKWQELADRVRSVGKAKMMIPYDHSNLKLKPQDLEGLYCGYAHVVPPATKILVEHFQAKHKEIHTELGYP